MSVPDMTTGFSSYSYEMEEGEKEEKKPTREPDPIPMVRGHPMAESSTSSRNNRPVNTDVVPDPGRHGDSGCCSKNCCFCCGSCCNNWMWIAHMFVVEIFLQVCWIIFELVLIIDQNLNAGNDYIWWLIVPPMCVQAVILTTCATSSCTVYNVLENHDHSSAERLSIWPQVALGLGIVLKVALMIVFFFAGGILHGHMDPVNFSIFAGCVVHLPVSILVVIGMVRFNRVKWQTIIARARDNNSRMVSGVNNSINNSGNVPIGRPASPEWNWLPTTLAIYNVFNVIWVGWSGYELFWLAGNTGDWLGILFILLWLVWFCLAFPPMIYSFPALFGCCGKSSKNGSVFAGIHKDMQNGGILNQSAEISVGIVTLILAIWLVFLVVYRTDIPFPLVLASVVQFLLAAVTVWGMRKYDSQQTLQVLTQASSQGGVIGAPVSMAATVVQALPVVAMGHAPGSISPQQVNPQPVKSFEVQITS